MVGDVSEVEGLPLRSHTAAEILAINIAAAGTKIRNQGRGRNWWMPLRDLLISGCPPTRCGIVHGSNP